MGRERRDYKSKRIKQLSIIMRLKEYIQHLKQIEQINPDVEVVCASDDEGNSFGPVHYHPSLGHYNGLEFENHADVSDKNKVNAVCLN